MGLFDTFKVDPGKPSRLQTKPEDARGVETSEFWLTLVIVAAGLLAEYKESDHHWLALAAGVAVIVYKLGRFSLKLRRSKNLPAVDDVMGELTAARKEIHDLMEGLKTEKKGKPELRAHPIDGMVIEDE